MYPFAAEAADDFVLSGDPGQTCSITNITFWFAFFNGANADTPASVGMTGVHVVVYNDIPNPDYVPSDPSSPPNIPYGEPIDTGGHTNALVEFFVPVELIVFTELDLPVTGQTWQADMLTSIMIPSGEKHWLALVPEFLFPPQAGIKYSEINTGEPAVQIFNLLALPWTIVPPVGDCPDVGQNANDLAFNMNAEPIVPYAYCPADCDGTEDRMVGIADLQALLGQWGAGGSCDTDGAGVGVLDLLALLGAWGPCPMPPNDDCENAQPVFEFSNAINLSGSTASLPAPACTTEGNDTWYVFDCVAEGESLVSTTIDVFVEVYDACSGALLDCGRGLDGVGTSSICGPGPDCVFGTSDDEPTQLLIRLIDDLGIGDGPGLLGTLQLTYDEGSECVPENDECVGAIPVFDGLTAFSTLDATTGGPQNGDPNLCSGGNNNPQCVHDIWYTYEAMCSGQLTIDTCEDIGGSADYDTDLWIYGPYATQGDINETSCANEALNANVATCNDDAIDWPCGAAAPWHSVAQLDVVAGEFYLVRVGGWQTEGSDLGTGVLQIHCMPPQVGASPRSAQTTTGSAAQSPSTAK